MNLIRDLRVAARRMRWISGLAIIAFGLGIGATTAVFSIFNGVLIQPLPYPDPDRLVVVYGTQPTCSTCPASYPKYIDWKNRNHVFSAIGGSSPVSFVVTGNGEPTKLTGIRTTASLGDVFGVKPLLGRWYTEQEDQFGGPKVAVLSHGFWTTRFSAAPGVMGRKIVLDDEPYEVIGVMPPSFTHRGGNIYVPLQRKLDPATRGNHFLATYARMMPGVTLNQAATEMRALGEVLAREYKYNHGIDVVSYREVVVGNIRTPLRILLGVVFLVLLIACANVANLLLASGLARRRELAIRVALGAGQKDLAIQLTTESVLLAVIGGGLGLLLAQWALDAFIVLAKNQIPCSAIIAIDSRVLVFTALVSIGVGIFCGIWPLMLMRTRELSTLVREGDTRTGTAAGRTLGNALVVAEIAVAFTLLAGAGLLVKNLIMLQSRDAGIRTDRVVAFDLSLSGSRYKTPEQVVEFYRELYSRLSQISGAESVGMTSHLPMYNFGFNGEFQIEGGTPWGADDAPLVEYRWMFGDYLKTMGVPLLKGRMLDQRDGKGSNAVLINHAMAEKFWPGKDPLGKRFGQDSDVSHWFEVAGVIGDIRSLGLTGTAPYEFYRTIEQSSFSAMTVVIRTRDEDPTKIVPSARQIVASIDAALPMASVQTMEQVVSASVGQPKLMSSLTGLFGGLAGLLAMVGVYGVMAYNVRRQRRDFGIRIALGADQRRVRSVVVGKGLVLAAIGVGLGSVGALLLTGVLKTMLNDVKPTDPAVFIVTAVGVLIVSILASYLPARSASRVDPMVVLRDS